MVLKLKLKTKMSEPLNENSTIKLQVKITMAITAITV